MSELTQYRDGLWLVDLSLPEFDVRGAVVCGRHCCLVWDTLSVPGDMEPVARLVAGMPLVVVYSHADWDHVWGTKALHRPQWVAAHSQCLRRFGDDVPEALREKESMDPLRWRDVELVPPNLTFESEMTLDLGGLGLTLRHLPGHTLDCIVGYVPQWGLLLAGDTVESPFPVLNHESPLQDWIKELRRWAALPELKTVVPSHGPVSDRELIKSNIDYLEALLEGRSVSPPDDSPKFYLETHRSNLAIAERSRRGS